MTETEWIAQYLNSIGGNATGKCGAAVVAMNLEFPDLKPVKGHVHFVDLMDGPQSWPHWWLVDGAGRIVDPTVSQFPPVTSYEPWSDPRGEPTGKCPNDGGYCFKGAAFCTDKCAREYMAYLNQSSRGHRETK